MRAGRLAREAPDWYEAAGPSSGTHQWPAHRSERGSGVRPPAQADPVQRPHGPRVTDNAESRRDAILEYLRRHRGSVESAEGRGLTAPMAEAVGYDNLAALNVILGRMEKEGVIVRDVSGGRTFRIALAAHQLPDLSSGPERPSDSQVDLANAVAQLQKAHSDLEDRLSAAEAASSQAGFEFDDRLTAIERSLAQASQHQKRRWAIGRRQ